MHTPFPRYPLILAAGFLLLCGCSAPSGSGREPPGLEQHDILAEFKISRHADPIVLPVHFKGREYLFLLDTGCSHVIFDTSLKEHLGPTRSKSTAIKHGRIVKADCFDAPEGRVGTLDLSECGGVMCADLSLLRAVTGCDVRGILGMNFLKDHVIHLDFDRGRLLFLRPGKAERWKCGQTLSMPLVKGVPRCTVLVAGEVSIAAVVDTGKNGSLSIPGALLDRLVRQRKLVATEGLHAAIAGTARVRCARLDKVAFGEFECQSVLANASDMCIAGLGLLSRFTVTMDFPGRALHLKSRNFDKADEDDMSGLHVLRINEQVVVHSVDKDSPGDRAGVKKGDVVLSVDGKGASDCNLFDLRRLLMAGEGREIRMAIRRDTEEREIRFTLRKRI